MTTLLLLATLLPASLHAPAEAGWSRDYAKASAAAQGARKDLLVWVHDPKDDACKSYAAKVAEQPDFVKAASARHVLVRLAPAELSALPNMADVKIEKVPALVLVLSGGDPYSVMESGASSAWREPAGAIDLVEMRREMVRDIAVSSAKLAADHAGAAPEARWAAWDACAKALEDSPAAAALPLPHAPLARVVREALKEDPDNGRGKLQRALKLLLALDMATEADLAAAPKADPDNQLGLLELKLSIEVAQRFKQLRDDAKQLRDARAQRGPAQLLESQCATLESALAEIEAFQAQHGFRDPRVGFNQFHAVATGAWTSSRVFAGLAQDAKTPKNERESAQRSVDRLQKAARRAAQAARAFGLAEEGPLKVLDDILGTR